MKCSLTLCSQVQLISTMEKTAVTRSTSVLVFCLCVYGIHVLSLTACVYTHFDCGVIIFAWNYLWIDLYSILVQLNRLCNFSCIYKLAMH